jgi:hypothetical protein
MKDPSDLSYVTPTEQRLLNAAFRAAGALNEASNALSPRDGKPQQDPKAAARWIDREAKRIKAVLEDFIKEAKLRADTIEGALGGHEEAS